ncbi:MAG: hypothetical protein A2Y12_11285 [Planctomycetes bacterium GWF2_42_9]|nr:MAG: hypothetical protein A2Y12_11285 [Planctomycetes bacterium GWF2_42_9]HAL45140.1 hypothetical protein [Phycisphaerales bacterium]
MKSNNFTGDLLISIFISLVTLGLIVLLVMSDAKIRGIEFQISFTTMLISFSILMCINLLSCKYYRERAGKNN